MSSKEEMEEINDVSDSDRKAFNDMFMVFDYNGDGSVEASDVKQVRVVVFRLAREQRSTLNEKTNKQAFKAASGRDIPDDEIEELIKKAGGSNGKLDQGQFVSMMTELKKSCPTRRELTDSFAVFDKSGNKNIQCKEFKKAMKEMGAKPMKDSEVDKFIAFANVEDSSGFAYDSLIEVMASQKSDKIPWMEKPEE